MSSGRVRSISTLCCALAIAAGVGRAGADEIDQFDRLCFPDLSDAKTFAERAARAGWRRAEIADHPKLAQAVGNLVTAPGAKITTTSVDAYETTVGSPRLFAIFQETESRSAVAPGRINICRVYNFEAAKPADDDAFRKRYFDFEAIAKNPDAPLPVSFGYARIRNAFLSAGKPQDDVPPEPADRLLDGIHLSASRSVE